MQLKTILNRSYRHKAFVYQNAKFVRDGDGREAIEVAVPARVNSKPICSECRRPSPGYDRLEERRYQMVPVYEFRVSLVYRPRRVAIRIQEAGPAHRLAAHVSVGMVDKGMEL